MIKEFIPITLFKPFSLAGPFAVTNSGNCFQAQIVHVSALLIKNGCVSFNQFIINQ